MIGRYHAYTDELDIWQRAHDRTSDEGASAVDTKAPDGQPIDQDESETQGSTTGPPKDRGASTAVTSKPRLRAGVWLASLLAAVALLVLAWVQLQPADPVKAALLGTSLEAYDVNGRRVWSVPMPGVGNEETGLTLTHDVDGDGRNEVIFNYEPRRKKEAGQLICFDAKGSRLWQLSYAADLAVGDRAFEPRYFGSSLKWVEMGGDSFVLVVASHELWYPTQLLLLDPGTGALRARYWHPGRVHALELLDVDQDGVDELLVGGQNNPGPGPGRPSLAVLEVPFGEPDASLPNFFGAANAREKAYFLFPRLDHWNLRGNLACVIALDVTGPDLLRVTVEDDVNATIYYTMDRDLRVLAVLPSDNLLLNHNILFRQDGLPHAYHVSELEDWRRILSFSTAPDGNSSVENLRRLATPVD